MLRSQQAIPVALEFATEIWAYSIDASNDMGLTALHSIAMDRYNRIPNRIALFKATV